MADELIDILDNDLNIIKSCLKSKAHQKGWLHATVHIWFYTEKGGLLFQKRSKNKISFPDLWDVSVAGHIGTGESEITSAIREVFEEIGLSIEVHDLSKVGTYIEKFEHNTTFIDNEVHHIYLCELCGDINLLKLQKEELSAVKIVSIEDFERLRNGLNFHTVFVPHHSTYYDLVLKNIKLKLLKT